MLSWDADGDSPRFVNDCFAIRGNLLVSVGVNSSHHPLVAGRCNLLRFHKWMTKVQPEQQFTPRATLLHDHELSSNELAANCRTIMKRTRPTTKYSSTCFGASMGRFRNPWRRFSKFRHPSATPQMCQKEKLGKSFAAVVMQARRQSGWGRLQQQKWQKNWRLVAVRGDEPTTSTRRSWPSSHA